MLIETLHKDMIAARQGNDAVAKNLLVTLYSESLMIGKNKRNGNPTDDEVVAMVKKFAANAEETRRLLQQRNQDSTVQTAEIAILDRYMPQQMDRSTLETAVRNIVNEMKLEGSKAMGLAMAELKKNYSGQYDGKMASEVVKSVLG